MEDFTHSSVCFPKLNSPKEPGQSVSMAHRLAGLLQIRSHNSMNSEGKEWKGMSTVWPLTHHLVHLYVPTERPTP